MHIILDTPGGTGLYLSYNIIGWIFTVILISFGLWQIALNKKIYYSPMLIGLTVGCCFLVIPAFYNFEFTDHAIPRLLALIGGLLLLVSLYQFKFSKHEQQQFLWLILIAVLLEASLGIAQLFLFKAGFWGGYKVGISRPHGVFLQPNVMASFMATGIAIAMYLSASFKKSTSDSKPALPARLPTLLIYLVLLLSSFLLVALQSRTGFIGAIVAIILLIPYLYKRNKIQLYRNLFIIFFGVTTALATFKYIEIPKRDQEIYYSAGVRNIIFEVSTDMVLTKPVEGYGYGHFERSFLDHFNEYAIDNPEVGNTIQRLSHPHNEVLYWAVEGGVIALLGFIIFTFTYINLWLRIPITNALALLALVIPILLHSQLEFPFYSSISHYIIFVLLLWFTDAYRQNIDSKECLSIDCNKTFLIRFFALFIPVLFIPFLATSLHTAYLLVEHEKKQYLSLTRLTQIINPIAWQDRLDSAVYANILVSGIADKNPEKLERYLAWGYKRVQYLPRDSVYANMLIILKILNRPEQYQQLLEEAIRTYPHRESWHKKIPQFKIIQ
jgi:O-antigen polymerase